VRRFLFTSIATAGVALAVGVGLAGAHSGSATAARAATVSTGKSAIGRVIVDGSGKTLYVFGKDKGGKSSCYGQCASNWPPLLTKGKARVGKGVKSSLLGSTVRKDGKRQVTYAGRPVYRFVKDTAKGQTNGEGLTIFGGTWYAVAPSGKKIDND